MINCRFLTPCGLCEVKSMTGLPVECEKNVDYVLKVYPPSDPEDTVKAIKNMEEQKHEV